eukprot:TRINITY_DN4164_c0_g1_i1.p1 TRINITY_DN4164_c0_g1~~TRINITY_DN4164_c0_g1_i1.p1  ORF type:complete len:124 (-),score=6.24 TRINITY_DN4164_c0_g1_i1:621-992(-)
MTTTFLGIALCSIRCTSYINKSEHRMIEKHSLKLRTAFGAIKERQKLGSTSLVSQTTISSTSIPQTVTISEIMTDSTTQPTLMIPIISKTTQSSSGSGISSSVISDFGKLLSRYPHEIKRSAH